MYLSLQICRALAALMVVCFHVSGHLYRPDHLGEAAAWAHRLCSFGDAGVPFFFVLSGFIVTRVHRHEFNQPARALPYLIKRVIRIYPIYWLVFGVTYIGLRLMSPGNPLLPPDTPTLLWSVLLLPQRDIVWGMSGAPVVFVAWTLQYEIAFYALLALAFVRTWWLLLPLLLVLLNRAWSVLGTDWWSYFISNNLVMLLALGSAWGLLLPVAALPRKVAAWLIAVGGLGFLTMAVWEIGFPREHDINRTLVYGVFCMVLVLGLVALEDSGWRPSSNSIWVRLGDASYSLYLIHAPWMSLATLPVLALERHTHVISNWGAWGGGLATATITLSACWVALRCHVHIERPLTQFAKRLAARFTA